MPQPAVDAVQVMTHHAAKGLEWPVVILVDLASDLKNSIWNSVRAVSSGAFDVRRPLADRQLRYWPWPYGAQSKVAIGDAIATGQDTQALRDKAVEEHKRLLYVSMTRARDLIVFARPMKALDGEWMKAISLSDWLPTSDGPSILLNNGEMVPFKRRIFDPNTAAIANPSPSIELRWFQGPEQVAVRLPLTVSPSQSPAVEARVAESAQVGTRITVDRHADFSQLGNALHACLGADLAAPLASLSESEVNAILVRHKVDQDVSTAEVRRQLIAVREWLGRRWHNARLHVELPVTQILSTGQILSGRIDLLVETELGWILIDHKATGHSSHQWDALAASYGGQLAAYRAAIETATRKPVIECWLLFPVAGSAVRIDTIS